jgi:hypothetical protein
MFKEYSVGLQITNIIYYETEDQIQYVGVSAMGNETWVMKEAMKYEYSDSLI